MILVIDLGSPDAVLILDETGFLKKGSHSARVQRQYSGTAGRIENSQIGVFLGYAGKRDYVLLDRELYIPQQWAEDGARRRAAGIPNQIEFQTKPMLGRRMLERAFQSGVSCGWVAGDEVYGRDSKQRRWLEARRQPYVLALAADQRLWRQDMRQHRVDEIANQLPKRAWKRLSAGQGAKGERLYDWALLPWAECFQLPTISAPSVTPSWMSTRRVNPLQIVSFPGGESELRARYPPSRASLIR